MLQYWQVLRSRSRMFLRDRARDLVRDAAILQQTDHRGHAHGDAGGVQKVSVFFFGHGDALQHEHDGAARGANIDRLIGGVQHQHGLMQSVPIAIRNACPKRALRAEDATACCRRNCVSRSDIDLLIREPPCPRDLRPFLRQILWQILRHNEMTSEIFKVRATVATHTRAAPARRSTRAHSEAVVPVVNTSSMSKMSRFTIRAGSLTAKAPRKFSRR